jgi:hypothetical protein
MAILYGPVEDCVTAVVERVPGDPELMDGYWKCVSPCCEGMEFTEDDLSIPIDRIKKRALILLGNVIEAEKKALENAMGDILALLFKEEIKDEGK